MSKSFYLYDGLAVFTEIYVAQESPEDPGEYIRPLRSTPIPPPIPETDDESAIFFEDRQAWEIVLDFRGRVFYNQTTGELVTIDTVGQVPDHLMGSPPPKTQLQIDADTRAMIFARLEQIDLLSLRPLRSVYSGTDIEADHQKLADLESESIQLRDQLSNLS